jgi:3',5'-cyclic-nucleotide phosphodiesterase
MFRMLLHIGALPPYPSASAMAPAAKSPMASLLSPLGTLTLLISTIGHDVGHPGVNNKFLVKLNAPLAQLYNDTSVLEAFHCAAFSQILRRHWPAAFSDTTIRPLLISTILATDMCLHFQFIERLQDLQRKYHEGNGTDGWSTQDLETSRTLLCSLLIKCADISNVVRGSSF